MYAAIKHLHILCAMLSGSGFLLQGIWMMRRSPLLDHRATRVVPHVVDTVFLASAITLAVLSAQYPFVAPWVTAKVIGLVVYVVLGYIALRGGATMGIRIFALICALLVFSWIVSVALTKNAAGFLVLTGAF
ncbi:SirB2 family protein [Aromatoleum aromaticum]|uniref:Predicted Invasion gene expression up-regulator, SirB n=1 Tax=Aromatoleum aromaticum (strain DSM 19018 / LMG 30748 / EbN1) TaxID=76114 RepID=Q5P0W4_AROAE|nr:SirB2 family protein [Aromatoleum aromaticum]NMG55816.1 regulator SirB [Aromatoleum aromaticum]CAI09050.1 predicted Invasion gene expression up-regulator, SirB [Aromatoleum aromaticum EbN1]